MKGRRPGYQKPLMESEAEGLYDFDLTRFLCTTRYPLRPQTL
jgi:hypothetical protein